MIERQMRAVNGEIVLQQQSQPLQHSPLGSGYFDINDAGTWWPAVAGGGRGGGHHRRDRGGQGARVEVPPADPLPGHPAAPRGIHQPGLPQSHHPNSTTRESTAASFPIKVNQLREVVEEILDAGKPYDFGLEVGSKPELFAGLALQSQMGSLIICNGYKDPAFIRMALHGHQAGQEGDHGGREARGTPADHHRLQAVGVEPLIGIRAAC
jgi:hypothetical protein